jgi:hypothetical protein
MDPLMYTALIHDIRYSLGEGSHHKTSTQPAQTKNRAIKPPRFDFDVSS